MLLPSSVRIFAGGVHDAAGSGDDETPRSVLHAPSPTPQQTKKPKQQKKARPSRRRRSRPSSARSRATGRRATWCACLVVVLLCERSGTRRAAAPASVALFACVCLKSSLLKLTPTQHTNNNQTKTQTNKRRSPSTRRAARSCSRRPTRPSSSRRWRRAR